MNCSTEDSRARWLWCHPVLIAVIECATVGAVASLLGIPMLAASMLVDLIVSITRLSIVDEALLNWHRFLALRRWLLIY